MKKAKILAVLIAALLTSVISTPCINAFAVSSLKDFSIITKEPEYFPATNNLEVGLYWFDQYNRVHNSNSPTPYFDKTKPTVIFVHGWAESILKNAGLSDSFPNFQYQPYADPTIDINVLKDWINKGYNVGIFNWKQLADEPIVECAEDKIWTSQHWVGLIPINMRWKKITGYETKNMPNKTSADLFYESYSKAMEGYEGDDIRIIGHSLGNQMAIRLVDLVDKHIENGDIPKELMPDRVALLDPYYSERSKSYLNGNTTADEADKIVRRLIDKQKIVFEMYKSSALTNNNLSGDSNRALEKMCYHADLYPNYFFLME
ncbi:hypothetical protein LGL55_20075 [Clostridium tagluense]|uniref:hypothetical protein n=1 Tax=Clostridium tagluense TaxID=360422 RepID=UPI001CF0E1FC|nr:hypothetical protein [Clostridium tagluense]MCB2313426.1 hypothetical protein [Clostridium tagluense]MCB2318220.1 hypothetical protein [Clostridium tagluense]MCB2323022.1 hypothetical protein [Clostridium tagluense]MCB2328034.1 hypothetical protein [Clostridium tagluense]MCB2332753.1 hypothetical protein [Clostridium tagluense]